MIERKNYSEEFKKRVAKSYLTSTKSLGELSNEFKVSKPIISIWSQKYKNDFLPESRICNKVSTFKSVINKEGLMKAKKLTSEEMAERILKLEQELKQEKMHRQVLDTMIDIAERDLNISIRKKAGARQSK